MGLKEAIAYLARLQGNAQAANHFRVRVGSNLQYAWGIEFGRTRGGRMARRKGGVLYLTKALADVKPTIKQELRASLIGGPGATLAALRKLGYSVEGKAKVYETAVVTGSLRRSIHTVVG